MYLEHLLEVHPDFDNGFFFDVEGTSNPNAIKTSASYQLRQHLEEEEMAALIAQTQGSVGTHSIRKFSVCVSRASGCLKDDTDCRGP